MNMKHIYFYSPYILILLVFVLPSCTTSETPSGPEPGPVAPITSLPEDRAQTDDNPSQLVEKTSATPFSYNPKGRRDPFRSIVVSRGAGRNPTAVESLPPLQRKDISDLKLKGIIWGDFGPSAIITIPDGKGYPVRVGTRIGLNQGVIKRITQNEIIIEETLLNLFGEESKNDVVMELHPQKERLE